MKKSFKHMDRRKFMKLASLSSIPITLGGFPVSSYAINRANLNNPTNDNVLVIIQLQGGNDGLNTLFDYQEYSNLYKVRQNIIVPENQILPIGEKYGFHPAMTGFRDLWESEQLGIVQNVGYPNQNRSHFRSTDIWNSASAASQIVNTGWLGRYFENQHPSYPDGYPNDDNPHPFVLTIGSTISETCQGSTASLGLNVEDPLNIISSSGNSLSNIPDDCYGDALQYLITTSNQAAAYGKVIKEAANLGNNISDKYNDTSGELAQKLKKVALLISGGLQTKVYIVQLGGFDTHDNQSLPDNPSLGAHASLLKELSDSICAFQDDIKKLNIDHRVLGMTYSEFGRQIRSNAAYGTDHGTAAPLFMFGSCVNNQIKGDPFKIDPDVDFGAGVPHQIDFRYIYGTMLTKWLGSDISLVRQVLFAEFENIDIIKENCKPTSSIPYDKQAVVDIKISPNPTQDYAKIIFDTPMLIRQLIIMDSKGGVVFEPKVKLMSEKVSELQFDISVLPAGIYFLNIQGVNIQKTLKLVKL